VLPFSVFSPKKINSVYLNEISFILILRHWRVSQKNLTLYDDRFLELASIHEKHALNFFTKLKLDPKCEPKKLKFGYVSMKK
jgi:hypothetical protein